MPGGILMTMAMLRNSGVGAVGIILIALWSGFLY